MSWNKTHSKALEEKVARIKSANQELREQLKAKDKKIEELEEAMKPKCEQCDNNHKDRTVFYDGKKILLCTLCKYNAVSYFKPKDNK